MGDFPSDRHKSLGAEGCKPHFSDKRDETRKDDLFKVINWGMQNQVPLSSIEGMSFFDHILLSSLAVPAVSFGWLVP